MTHSAKGASEPSKFSPMCCFFVCEETERTSPHICSMAQMLTPTRALLLMLCFVAGFAGLNRPMSN